MDQERKMKAGIECINAGKVFMTPEGEHEVVRNLNFATKENEFLVPTKALRDEGTSYHYLPASRSVEIDRMALDAIEKTFATLNLPFRECTTWTTDGFFRETKDMVEYRKAEGCSTVEMECAALAACAQKRGAVFGQILYTADSLANVYAHDDRDWGRSSLRKALEICIEMLRNF